MYLLIEILICLLNTLGTVYDLEPSFLGFMVVAFGNAFPESMNTLHKFKKKGNALSTMSGSYNGQLYSLLIGFGIGNLKLTLTRGT